MIKVVTLCVGILGLLGYAMERSSSHPGTEQVAIFDKSVVIKAGGLSATPFWVPSLENLRTLIPVENGRPLFRDLDNIIGLFAQVGGVFKVENGEIDSAMVLDANEMENWTRRLPYRSTYSTGKTSESLIHVPSIKPGGYWLIFDNRSSLKSKTVKGSVGLIVSAEILPR